MNILQINSVVNKGSTGKIAENIGLLIQQKGWESYIAYGKKSNKSTSNLYKIGSVLSIYIHAFGTRLTDRHGFFSNSETSILIQKIKRIKPSIIHLHNIHGYYLNIEILFNFLSESNIPVVWTLHDCWPFTGHCAYYSAIKCDKWKKECNNCPQIRSYPKSWLIDGSKKNYYLKKKLFNSLNNVIIVPVSQWLEQQVKKSFLKNNPTKVINNGVDLKLFKFMDSKPIVADFFILGLATTWDERKGLDDYIQLSRFLRHDEVIVLVGLSKSQINKLPKNIIGLRRTSSQNELVKLYSQAGVVMSLSVEETFGMTVVEGFACGTPAIVYNSTATPELITEETGLIVEPHDIQGLRMAIDQIRKSKINFRKTCRARAEKLYNKDDRYNDYIELYKEILNKH